MFFIPPFSRFQWKDQQYKAAFNLLDTGIKQLSKHRLKKASTSVLSGWIKAEFIVFSLHIAQKPWPLRHVSRWETPKLRSQVHCVKMVLSKSEWGLWQEEAARCFFFFFRIKLCIIAITTGILLDTFFHHCVKPLGTGQSVPRAKKIERKRKRVVSICST